MVGFHHDIVVFHILERCLKKPDITSYPWQRRRDYLLLVAAVASIDQELHPHELALLERWIEIFKLSPKCRQQVLDTAHSQGLDVKLVQKRLSETDLTYSLILDLMGMAMADGILMDKEIQLLRGISVALKVDPIDFNILIEFVHSAHQASLLSNPEPLFEHNIESAFALLKRKQVSLFPHTQLCVSSTKYNDALMARWFRYRSA